MQEIKFRIFDKEKSKIRFDFIIETKSYEKDFKKCIKDYDWNILKDIEIMQYLWIKDMYKKEIYEWDIVQVILDNNDKYILKIFDEHYFRNFIEKNNIWDLKVIWNIYENPEIEIDN